MKKFYAITNALVIVAVIIWNYAINSIGINGDTIREISSQYSNFFTPASYAFSIWGIIFFGLIVLVIFQLYRVYTNHSDTGFITVMGPWLLLTNIGNGLWSYLFLTNNTGWSVVVLFTMLVSLIVIIVKLNMEQYDAPFPILAFVWWPISIYAGWVTVASIANVSAYLSKIGFDTIVFTDYQFTIIMIIIATIINLLMIKFRNMREFAMVGVWSLVAIAVKQWGTEPTIGWLALIGAVTIFIAISFHVHSNRDKSPLIKFREWKQKNLTL